MDDSLSSLASPNIFQTDNRRLHPTLRYSRKQTLLEEGSLIFEDLAQFSASSSSASGGDVRDLTNLDAETYTSIRNVFTSSTPSRELTSFSSGAAQEQLKQHPPDGEENNRLHRDAETGVPNYLLPASHCVSADYIGPPKVATENTTNDALKKEGHPFFQVESSLKGPETTLLPPPQPHPYSLVFSENLRGSDRLQQQHSPPPILPIQGSVDGPARDLRFGGSQSDGFVAEGRIETGFRSCLAEDERLLLPPSVVHPSARLYPPGEVCGRVNSGPVECVPPSLFSLPSASSTPWQIPTYLQPQPSLPELSGAGGPSGFGWPRPLEPNSPRGCLMSTGISTGASVGRRKNATRESTSTLKAWLQEHIKNPYPTKGEKIMLAIITKMTLTQVSTWFANARRRLKKENKMTWTPRNRNEESGDLDNRKTDRTSSEDSQKGVGGDASYFKSEQPYKVFSEAMSGAEDDDEDGDEEEEEEAREEEEEDQVEKRFRRDDTSTVSDADGVPAYNSVLGASQTSYNHTDPPYSCPCAYAMDGGNPEISLPYETCGQQSLNQSNSLNWCNPGGLGCRLHLPHLSPIFTNGDAQHPRTCLRDTSAIVPQKFPAPSGATALVNSSWCGDFQQELLSTTNPLSRPPWTWTSILQVPNFQSSSTENPNQQPQATDNVNVNGAATFGNYSALTSTVSSRTTACPNTRIAGFLDPPFHDDTLTGRHFTIHTNNVPSDGGANKGEDKHETVTDIAMRTTTATNERMNRDCSTTYVYTDADREDPAASAWNSVETEWIPTLHQPAPPREVGRPTALFSSSASSSSSSSSSC